ncbi:sporulation protein YqfD [Paenibacillus sp. 1001270B_150601_E10]|uniref:sporulation protein YqfD n=1 Tax=Paenibacillus sp. 1001270B_150601_E10 TaxID=2787079 RepID=UPI00189E3C3C|nr:sporulation protein YqfD [Paenibacillus sp. 1001270B_150601_E10]
MKPPASAKWRGYIRIAVRGKHTEQFINELYTKEMMIWDISRIGENQVSMMLMLPDFFRLRPLLKRTGCRVHVMERHGLPFSVKQVRKRTFFITGLFLFLFGLYMLSSLVWTIEVKGNERIHAEEVLAAAKEEGVYPFQWSFRLKKMDELSKEIHAHLPDATWVGVAKQGTKIVIHIVESAMPDDRKLVNPRHLVANTDAVVTQIIASQGKAVVRPNTRVKKGNVLISGIIGSTDMPRIVPAEGIVKGLVWHEYNISTPLITKEKTFTGEFKERQYIQMGDRRLQVSGYGEIDFTHYEIQEDEQQAGVYKWQLPIKWVHQKIMEVQEVSRERSEEEAVEAGLEQARADIAAKHGGDSRIVTEKILHQKADNGKVKLKVLFEVEQSIAVERPIVSAPEDLRQGD